VGAAVPWAAAQVGAIATQAQTNESFGPNGLAIVDARGRVAAHTGRSCLDWAGQHTGAGYSCQGNILAGAAVVEAMARAYEATDGELSHRLLAALVAAQEAGGDKRGKQSAAILVVRPSERYPEYRTALAGVNLDESLAAATLAVEIEPQNPEILDTLAEVHFRRGEVDQAIAAGERALARDPESTYLQEQLERFQSTRDKRHWSE
jgi:uncharacterized Ntn-hydrolase superfamily protein